MSFFADWITKQNGDPQQEIQSVQLDERDSVVSGDPSDRERQDTNSQRL